MQIYQAQMRYIFTNPFMKQIVIIGNNAETSRCNLFPSFISKYPQMNVKPFLKYIYIFLNKSPLTILQSSYVIHFSEPCSEEGGKQQFSYVYECQYFYMYFFFLLFQDGYWATDVCDKQLGYICKKKPSPQSLEKEMIIDPGCQKVYVLSQIIYVGKNEQELIYLLFLLLESLHLYVSSPLEETVFSHKQITNICAYFICTLKILQNVKIHLCIY